VWNSLPCTVNFSSLTSFSYSQLNVLIFLCIHFNSSSDSRKIVKIKKVQNKETQQHKEHNQMTLSTILITKCKFVTTVFSSNVELMLLAPSFSPSLSVDGSYGPLVSELKGLLLKGLYYYNLKKFLCRVGS